MKPEEKAKELIEKFRKEYAWVEKDYSVDLWRDAKACAVILCEEIMPIAGNVHPDAFLYWQQVKEEIQKL